VSLGYIGTPWVQKEREGRKEERGEKKGRQEGGRN
jgi:hypothetical protein